MEILGFDIQEAFTPDVSPFEMFVRGTLIYVLVFVILRVALRRKSGAVAFTDLLVLVLIADAAQNGMAANYSSITDGLILIGTLVFWAYAIDWLGFHLPWFRRYVHPPVKAARGGRPHGRANVARGADDGRRADDAVAVERHRPAPGRPGRLHGRQRPGQRSEEPVRRRLGRQATAELAHRRLGRSGG